MPEHDEAMVRANATRTRIHASGSSLRRLLVRGFAALGWLLLMLLPWETVIPRGKPRPGVLVDWWDVACLADLDVLDVRGAREPIDRPTRDGLGFHLQRRCRVTGAQYISFRRPTRFAGIDQVTVVCPGFHVRIEWRYPWQKPKVLFYQVAVSADGLQWPAVGVAPVRRAPGWGWRYVAGLPSVPPARAHCLLPYKAGYPLALHTESVSDAWSDGRSFVASLLAASERSRNGAPVSGYSPKVPISFGERMLTMRLVESRTLGVSYLAETRR